VRFLLMHVLVFECLNLHCFCEFIPDLLCNCVGVPELVCLVVNYNPTHFPSLIIFSALNF